MIQTLPRWRFGLVAICLALTIVLSALGEEPSIPLPDKFPRVPPQEPASASMASRCNWWPGSRW